MTILLWCTHAKELDVVQKSMVIVIAETVTVGKVLSIVSTFKNLDISISEVLGYEFIVRNCS